MVVVLLVVAIVSTVLAVVFHRRQKNRLYIPPRETLPDSRTENSEPCKPSPGHIENDGGLFSNKNVARDEILEGTTNPQMLSGSSQPEISIVKDTSRGSSLTAMEEGQSVPPTRSTDFAEPHNSNEGKDEKSRSNSEQEDKAIETGHSATPEQFTDSPSPSPRKRKMSLTQRVSDTFKRSSTASISLAEAQGLLHDEDSRTAEASSTNTFGDVTEQQDSRRYDSRGERVNPSKSSIRRGSALQSFRRLSTKSTDSTSEDEKSRSKSRFAYKPMPKVDNDSETEM